MVSLPFPLFIGAQIYRGSSYGALHPLAIPRVPTVIDLCQALDWLPRAQYRTSPCAKPAMLETFHTPQYIAALQAAESAGRVSDLVRDRHQIGTASNPVFAEMFRRPTTAAGGSLLAVELLRNGGIVYNPGGGTHHGMPDRANGFCYLNDPVLAIQALRRQGLERIAYVDIDAHHCDGVEAALAGVDGILLVSTHEERRWPFTGGLHDRAGGVALNIPLPKGTNDSEFMALLEAIILPAVAQHRPQAIVFQCGADAVLEDPLSRLGLSNTTHWQVALALKTMAPRLLVLGGGRVKPLDCWALVERCLGHFERVCYSGCLARSRTGGVEAAQLVAACGTGIGIADNAVRCAANRTGARGDLGSYHRLEAASQRSIFKYYR